ncbi:MAG: hypothetical protein ABJE10_07475 [bacterium]
MEYIITHAGVPIGRITLKQSEQITGGDVTPLPGYDTIRDIVHRGSDALSDMGVFGSVPPSNAERVARKALTESAALGRKLELCTLDGTYVDTDWIELVDDPREPGGLSAFVGFGRAHSVIAATRASRRVEGPAFNVPESPSVQDRSR